MDTYFSMLVVFLDLFTLVFRLGLYVFMSLGCGSYFVVCFLLVCVSTTLLLRCPTPLFCKGILGSFPVSSLAICYFL